MNLIMALVLTFFALVLFLGGLWFFLRPGKKKGKVVPAEVLDESGPEQRNWLLGVEGEVKGNAFHIGSRAVTIGRAVTNYIQLEDRNASRVHCSLIPVRGSLQVKDLESNNGILVNGERVKTRILEDGDLLQIGENVFEYKASGHYEVRDSANWKYVGESAISQTIGAAEGIDGLGVIIARALEQTGGDVEKAAAMLQLKVDVVEQFAAKNPKLR